jgi:hypothetical protein
MTLTNDACEVDTDGLDYPVLGRLWGSPSRRVGEGAIDETILIHGQALGFHKVEVFLQNVTVVCGRIAWTSR